MTENVSSPRKNSITTHSFLDTLAEIACRKSPLRSVDSTSDGNSTAQSHELPVRRPRANSEPWIRNNFSGINALTMSTLPIIKKDSPTSIALPQMLEKYSSIYNKNGRIGIYTREERDNIITRFHQKRKRRVWKKKIRYHCRKNLADSRVRVKGRFVKSMKLEDIAEESEPQDEGTTNRMNALLMASLQSENEKEKGSVDATDTDQKPSSEGSADTDTLTAQDKHSDDEGEDEVDDDEYDDSVMPSIPAQPRKRMRRHSIAY